MQNLEGTPQTPNQVTGAKLDELHDAAVDGIANRGPKVKEGSDYREDVSHAFEDARRVGREVVEVTSGHSMDSREPLDGGLPSSFAVVRRAEAEPSRRFGIAHDAEQEQVTHDALTHQSHLPEDLLGEPSADKPVVTSFDETKPSLTHGGEIRRRVFHTANEDGDPVTSYHQETTDAEGKVVRSRDWMSYPDSEELVVDEDGALRPKGSRAHSSDVHSHKARKTAEAVAERVSGKISGERPLVSDRDKTIQAASEKVQADKAAERERVEKQLI